MPYLGVRPADITSATEAEIAGDLTVDTSTLVVDAANNRVGVGTASPASAALHIDSGSDNANTLMLSDGAADGNIVDGFVTSRHHSVSEEPVLMIQGRSTSSENIVLIGGTHNNSTYNTATSIKFFTASGYTNTTPVEKMRVTGDGLTFNGDTAAANALDDYEEGVHEATLTPSTSGSITLSSGFNTFQYIKIGSLVNVSGRVRVSSVSSPVGALRVSLPFTTAAIGEDAGRVTGTGLIQGAVLNAGQYVIHPTAENNSYVEFYKGNGPNLGSATSNDFDGDELVSINITYRAA
tara:strand:+ start:298 stop:1179 length:882 start_codon:yes stop_codon:yes gene_type:complete